MTILAVILYLPVLVFGTHFIRTWAFNRHEAVTFESSSIMTLISLFLIWEFGPSKNRLLLSVILLLMFIANAFTQWFFYMRLQKTIKDAFSVRTNYIKQYLGKGNKENGRKDDFSVVDSLETMASVAIMPSFSRFIEESKYFNNPGNLIGLVKSIMKRQRFQKKKYLMRECFAEILNLIAPCKPDIKEMMKDDKRVVPGTVLANDLALEKKDEIAGLVSFDVLGFGAHIILFIVLLRVALHGTEVVTIPLSPVLKTVLMALTALLFTAISRVLRHFGFARYESFYYELSFTALVIASFRIFVRAVQNQPVSGLPMMILGCITAVFVFLSWHNKHVDKKLHKKVDQKFDDVINEISFDTETDRTKKRILKDLDTISEWTIVPYSGNNSRFASRRSSDFSYSFSHFETINSRKELMPSLTADFINKVVSSDNNKVKEDDFRLSSESVRRSNMINDLVGTVSFIALFILIGYGWI